jgi:uncharacterized membrane protein
VGIDGAGRIVGQYNTPTIPTSHGFFYNGSTYATLDDPLGNSTSPYGINDSDQIVGIFETGSIYNGIYNGFIDTGGTYTTLNDPLGIGGTYVRGINDKGQVVGYYYDSTITNILDATHRYSFVYSGGAYTTLSDPLGLHPAAFDINDTGQIVGTYVGKGSSGGAYVYLGFLYSAGSYTTLEDPLGVDGTMAYGVNDAGQIVGQFIDGAGVYHGFFIAAEPTPPSMIPWG